MDLQLYSHPFSLINYSSLNTAYSEFTLKRAGVGRKISTLTHRQNKPALVCLPYSPSRRWEHGSGGQGMLCLRSHLQAPEEKCALVPARRRVAGPDQSGQQLES